MIDFQSDIILENDRVRLEPLSFDHNDGLFQAGNQDDSLLKYSFNRVHTKELLTEFLEKFIGDRMAETRYPFAIFDKQEGRYAGVTTFMSISNEHKRLEIGSTWIGKEFQRTGLNRNCKFLLLQYCFEKVGAERVELKTDARNEQSRTAILKIGATFEGELRNHSVMPDGFRRNTVVYSIVKEEWPGIKKDVFAKY